MDIAYALLPEWRALYCNDKCLEMNNREMLKESIDAILADLNKRYVDDTSPVFPTEWEHMALYKRCVALAKLLGLKNPTKFGGVLRVMNRIENRFSKIKLISFYDAMVHKLSKLDSPPQTRIYNAIQAVKQKDPAKTATLVKIYNFLKSQAWEHPLDSQPWIEWLEITRSLGLDIGIAAKGVPVEFETVEKCDKKFFAYFVFMNLLRQQILWMQKHTENTLPTVRFIEQLVRHKDIEQLRRVFHGPGSVVNLDNLLKNDEAKLRRVKSYRKLHARPKRKPSEELFTV